MQKTNVVEFKEKYLISLLSLFAEKKEIIDQYKTLNFNQLGINSLGFIKLLTNIEQKYKIKFSVNELIPDNYNNMQILIHIIKEKIKENKI